MNPNTRYEPWSHGGRIKAIVGHYGSGKTEFSLALALNAKENGYASMVVDLDIVNPFFRSAEQGDVLERRGVEMIYPPFARTGVDVPVLSAEILSVFERPDLRVAFDVGGDDAGAAALGRFKPQFETHGCDLIYVVNIFRPFSDSVERIMAMIDRISSRSRLRPMGLINNSNLGGLTRPEHIYAGLALLGQVSEQAEIPILATCAEQSVLDELSAIDTPVFPIERLTKPEWMEV